MSEIGYETNTAPGKIINRGDFDAGMYPCMGMDEFEAGAHITERHKLPLSERSLFYDEDSLSPAERPFAEDKTVVVTSVIGNTISVADLFHGGDEIVAGNPRSYTLTPDGWIPPAHDLPPQAIGTFPMEELIEGYFMNFDGLRDSEEAEDAVRSKVLAQPRLATMAVSGSTELPQY